MATTGLFSCRQGSKSTSDTVNKETLNSTENVQRQKPLTNHNEKYIDTKYEYTDSTGRSLIIQNSFPKVEFITLILLVRDTFMQYFGLG